MKAHGDRFAYGVVESTLILAIIAILFFTAWVVRRSSDATNKILKQSNQAAQGNTPTKAALAQSVTSFTACKQALGSELLQTYPEQCVTSSGKKFTDTAAAAPTARPARTKATADSPMPASGTCGTTTGNVVSVSLTEGVPTPRCSQVTSSQTLSVNNPTAQAVTVKLGGQSVTILAGQTGTISMPFGDYLETGDHVVQTGLYGGSGPEIYLPAN